MSDPERNEEEALSDDSSTQNDFDLESDMDGIRPHAADGPDDEGEGLVITSPAVLEQAVVTIAGFLTQIKMLDWRTWAAAPSEEFLQRIRALKTLRVLKSIWILASKWIVSLSLPVTSLGRRGGSWYLFCSAD